jgi:hypothetical protein
MHISLADDSAPAPSHEREGQDCGKSGGVLKLGHKENSSSCSAFVLILFLFSWQEVFLGENQLVSYP